MNKTLVIRADASTQMGVGHIMRCLALAQTWQDAGGEVLFVLVSSVPTLESRLKAEGLEVVHLASVAGSADEVRQTLALANNRGAAWVVADGYQFGAQYQRAIKQAGLHLLFVDDYGHASPSWDENPDERRGPPVADSGSPCPHKTPRAGGEKCARARGAALLATYPAPTTGGTWSLGFVSERGTSSASASATQAVRRPPG